MKLPRQHERTERRLADFARAFVRDIQSSIDLSLLRSGACIAAPENYFAQRSVLLATRSQLLSAVALVELDGLARRIVVAPPDLREDHLDAVIADAEIDAVASDFSPCGQGIERLSIDLPVRPLPSPRRRAIDTEWVLLTSGTSGRPKMVSHSLNSLTGAIKRKKEAAQAEIWSTFYDIRRYGGLQVFLRALLGGADLILASPDEPVGEQLARLGAAGVTSISGTPSHWRRVLMTKDRGAFSPSMIRLSGEIADQSALDGLRAAFPRARIVHAYASTEAGVGFAVDDGREGFPSALVDEPADGVEMKIADGALCIRSSRTASGFVGRAAPPLLDREGFVNTGDLVERRGDRYYFVGRRSGIINVGGLKVNPEEVEAILNEHPAVRMARVFGRKNPLSGAVVVAEVVARGPSDGQEALGREILAHCRDRLERHKTPATIRFVETMDLSAAGKLKREAALD